MFVFRLTPRQRLQLFKKKKEFVSQGKMYVAFMCSGGFDGSLTVAILSVTVIHT